MVITHSPSNIPPPRATTDDGTFAVLRLHGEIDLKSCPSLDRTLHAHTDTVVVDLSEVTLLSAAAVGVLVAHAQRLADDNGQLRIAAENPIVHRILSLTGADQLVAVHNGPIDAATTTVPFAAAESPLLAEILRLRSRLRTQPTIGQALGILQERYGLPDSGTAFELLKASSQRHNVRLHVLAAALLTAPHPASTDGYWFPGRRRPVPPSLSFTSHQVARGANRTAVLDALLDSALDCMNTGSGDLHAVDRVRGDLRLERHRGLTSEFIHFFDTRDRPTAASRVASHRKARVVIADVATDQVFTDRMERLIILATGICSMQSSPLLTSGRLLAMVSTYHAVAGQVPTTAQHSRLDAITGQAAAWLEWHGRTVVLDALEQVHQSARSGSGSH